MKESMAVNLGLRLQDNTRQGRVHQGVKALEEDVRLREVCW